MSFVYANFRTSDPRTRLRSWSLFELFSAVFLAINVWAFQILPVLPVFVGDYGAVFHFFHFGSWVTALILGLSRNKLLPLLFSLIRLVVLICDTIARYLSIFTLFSCWFGTPPPDCPEAMFSDVVAAFTSISFFLSSISILWNTSLLAKQVQRGRLFRTKGKFE